ncbi:MAG: hypothetical protein O2805_01500 [Proteobacteria bacterium]|nr:hypothetical protein [Pseudomonadota bacterium]
MPNSIRTETLKVLQIAISVTPWVLSIYIFYWLDSSGTWTSETPHRGKISVAILVAGMALSFGIYSYLARRVQK